MHIAGPTSTAQLIAAIRYIAGTTRQRSNNQQYTMAAPPVEGLKLQTKTDLKRVDELVYEYETTTKKGRLRETLRGAKLVFAPKEQKKASKNADLKELKMSYKIGDHDYDVRKRSAERFLSQGNPVSAAPVRVPPRLRHQPT